MSAYFIKKATLDDYQYLAHELFHCSSGVGQWAQRIIQLKNADSSVNISLFVTIMNILLTQDNTLNEDDYLQLWSQFPLFSVIHALFQTVSCFFSANFFTTCKV